MFGKFQIWSCFGSMCSCLDWRFNALQVRLLFVAPAIRFLILVFCIGFGNFSDHLLTDIACCFFSSTFHCLTWLCFGFPFFFVSKLLTTRWPLSLVLELQRLFILLLLLLVAQSLLHPFRLLCCLLKKSDYHSFIETAA